MDSKTPREIEKYFRNTLGQVNPYMCLVDVAVKNMIEQLSKDEIHNISKKHGYPNIITEHMNLNSLSQLVHLSHIAYIQGKAEEATIKIVKIANIRDGVKNFGYGGFLDKAIHKIHFTKHENLVPQLQDEVTKPLTSQYIGRKETLIIDYYRAIRNRTIHSDKERSDININDYFEGYLDEIEKKFGFIPNHINSLTENDVYLLSLVWQSNIKNLAKQCINIKRDILPKQLKKYRGTTLKRQQASIRNFLRLEYLISGKELDDIILEMGY